MGSSSRTSWELITDPVGTQRTMFRNSLDIYSQLFASQHTEPAENIEKYLIKNLGDCRREKLFPIRDYYLVGKIDDQVRGMAFLTTFRDWNYAFVSYLGVLPPLNQSSRLLAAKLFAALSGIFKHDRIEAILYEIERIKHDGLGIPAFQERISALRAFQHVGARAISCLSYLQPNLDEPCESRIPEKTDLRLMICEPFPIQPSSSLSREHVDKILQFVYQELYMSGYRITHPDRIDDAKEYLDRLRLRAMASLPPECQQVPLATVVTLLESKKGTSNMMSVFISHTSDGDRIAEILHSFLDEDMGLVTIEWNHDHHLRAGKGLDDTMESWVGEEDRFIIAVLTPKSVYSEGMLKEIRGAQKHNRPIIALVSSELKEPERSKAIATLGSEAPVCLQFEPNCLDRVLSDLHERLLIEIPGAISLDVLGEKRRRSYAWSQHIWETELKQTIPLPPSW